MAEFAFAGDNGGHSWNSAIAHASYADNASRFGEETARHMLRADIKSWLNEQKGVQSQWSLFVRDGQMVTQNGVSLAEMTDNITHGPHSNLVPAGIKATAHLEAATLEEATRLAVAGADRIILPEQHLNGRGEVVARYLSVWTKDASNPTLYRGSRIDLRKNLRIEDVRTGTSFAAFQDGQAIFFHEHREQKHAFVLSVQNNPTRPFESVEKSIVMTIHRSHQETYSRDLQSKALPISDAQARPEMQQIRDVFDERKTLNASSVQKVHDVDLFVRVPQAIVRETAETVRGVAAFLRDKEKRRETTDRIQNLSVVQRIRRIFEKGDQVIDNNNAAALLLSTNKKGEERENRPNVQPERLTIEKIREKPVRIVEHIKTRHTEMQKSVVALLVAADTKVALGAVPLVLAELAKEQPTPIRAVEKSIRRHERKVRRIKKISEKVQPLKTERVEPLKTAENKRIKKRKTVYRKDAVAEKMTPMGMLKPDTQERREKKKLRRAVEKSVRRHKKRELRRITRREAQKDSVKVQPLKTERVEPFKERKQSIQRKEREAVVAIRFVWVVWMLLTRKDTETPKNNFKRSHPASQGETLRRQEETPWILLSIIYYLTAIREQAMHNYPMSQISSVQQTIPQYAVIYPAPVF